MAQKKKAKRKTVRSPRASAKKKAKVQKKKTARKRTTTKRKAKKKASAGRAAKKKATRKKVGRKKAVGRKASARTVSKKKRTARKASKKKASGRGTARNGSAAKTVSQIAAHVPTATRDILLAEGLEISPATIVELELVETLDLDAGDGDFPALDWMASLGGELSNTTGIADGSEQAEGPEEMLLSSAECGDLEAVHSLIDAGTDLATRDERGATRGWTAPMLAARSGKGDVVRLLLNAGAEPDLTDDPADRHRATVRFLCRHEDTNADMEGMRLGRTACHFAAAGGHTDVIRVLIESGCDVNAADHTGKTPLMLAVKGGFLALARLLIQAGAAVEPRDLRDSNALLMAATAGNAELARLLINSGAEVDAYDGFYCTALMAAVSRAHADATRVLLSAGADVGREDYSGFGVLCFAIYAIEYVQKEAGTEALHPVPVEQILQIVHMLLDAGADDRPDGTGVRPSQRAQEQGHENVTELLRERGGFAAA